jgi:transposase
MWAEKGTRPRIVRQQQFESAYIFGAVCPIRDFGVGLILPYSNTEAMLIHLKHISAAITKKKHAIIIMDRASWHTTKKIKKFHNITIIYLPAASPELNPVEQVWQHLRRRELSNRCFKDYSEILDACSVAWNNFTNENGAIKSLCTRNWFVNFDH